ncbi:MAG: UDP-glucose/GDP-mannose dehydrogenase family protein [Gemmatimonadetes bacterium]|nr:UDP-glucose/GDP-mannose dehydrogenase family protein [Gemmatimonadota bacterium]
MTDSVSLVGLGKLGLCLAAVFAKKGLNTIAVDIERTVVDEVNQGRSPIVEPGLPELIAQVAGKTLHATLDHAEAIAKTDVTFVLVATPSNADGSFSNRHVESALRSLATAFGKSKKKYHLFVISSTVVPGSVDGSFIPLIEQASGRKLHEDFDVCYDPDFVALGDVINGFLKPELVIIGESATRGGDIVEAIHHKVCESKPHIGRMSLVSAEVAKVSLNSYITLKISFANTLANICQRIPGADVDAITRAIGADRRISPYYLKGGPAYGGTCFPRDTRAFITFARHHQNDAAIIRAVEAVNEHQHRELLDLVLRHGGTAQKTVGVLGLAFKPNTPVITESPGFRLIEELLKRDVEVVAFDPLAIPAAKVVLEGKVEFVSSPWKCLSLVDVCVVTTPDKAYVEALETWKVDRPLTVIDCWRLLNPARLDPKITYVALGYADSTPPAGGRPA